ncbi:MAG: TIGR03086 family metal-binding protein [Acidimicrobiales bacterium]
MPDLVAVLSEPNRRRLLELLSTGEQTVSQLAAQFGVTRSAISQHLGVLSSAGLVQARQVGRFRYYRLDPLGMSALREALEVFWTHELEELATARPPIGGHDTMTTAEKSVLVPLDPDATFALLTEPERLRRWQAVTARVELRAGGEYRWTIVPGHTASGTITEVEPGRRLVFSFGWEGTEELPPGASTVTITLEPIEGGTKVHLVHSGLTPEQAAGHLEGWTHYSERLVAAAERGDAGADEWAGAEPSDPLTAAEASLAICQLALRDLGPDDARAQTPCARYSLEDLVEHLVGSLVALGKAAGATAHGPGPRSDTAEARVADAAQATLETWRKRGLEGTVHLGQSELAATRAVDILLLELLVHAWDFARATGRPIQVDDALSGFVLEHARGLIAPPMRDGDRFAAERDAGPDADNLARLVAFTGRDA